MAGALKNKVSSVLNTGHPSSFYSNDKPNPVLIALNQETTQFVAFMKKRASPGYEIPEGEASSRPADTLFDLWNKYEPRLSKIYYQEKLLEMGDFLVSIEEYKLALWQCYDRYLQHFGEVNVEDITDVDDFRQTFFPGGFDADNAGLTFRALMGKSISMYQVVRLSDPKLQNKQSVERCVHILGFLRLVMQVVLPRESLCWLVFNGTVHIYSMARHLMSMGHSARVLEYVVWAAMCMETSVPLMAVKYLPWRATLYTTVCQCYYDCKAGQHAEAFARRGLAKINELSQLENLSNSVETPESEFAFRQATVRMAVMVYKRSVFETRRKPKGLLRPKTRANLKDAMNMPWPRTPTEKMLADMFEGGSAQFLAIMESLSDSNRRILLTSPPTLENEPEILDVYAELFMAAQEILAGGGGNRVTASKTQLQLGSPPLSAVVSGRSLIDMATRGEDGVPLDCAIRIVKLAYNFEHWDVFDALVEPVLEHIKEGQGEKFAWDEKALELLQASGRLNSSRRHGKRTNAAASTAEGEQDDNAEPVNPHTAQSSDARSQGVLSTRSMLVQDDLVNLADVLMSIVNGPFKREMIEVDMVIDAALYLWSKCKAVFQKFQTGSIDNPRYLQKMDNPHKWMYLLDSVHQALGWTGVSSVDPTLTAEVVLRLAMVYESSAQLEVMDEGRNRSPRSKMEREETQVTETVVQTSRAPSHTPRDSKMGLKESKTTLTDVGGGDVVASHASFLSQTSRQLARQQLMQAREILRLGLENVNYARTVVALNDGKSIADVSWIKKVIEDNESLTGELNPDVFNVDTAREGTVAGAEGVEDADTVNPDDLLPPSMKGSATAVWNTVKDLHLELILMYHRVTLKLANLSVPAEPPKGRTSKKPASQQHNKTNLADGYIESFGELKEACRRSLLSKSLLYMQRALMLGTDTMPTEEQRTLLSDALELIQKAQVEEQRTYFENTGYNEQLPTECHVPPPPLLLCRTDRTMVFKPAPFVPLSGEKVSWYRLFGRNAAGSNVKARMSDYILPGTGDEVPSYGCVLKVSGLCPNERYVFAVAAYTAEGKLIGNNIGETSKPILASHPLPILMTWAFLSQISYQVGHYPTAKAACDFMWDHFLAEPPPPEGVTYITEAKKDFKLTLLKLNQRAVCLSSPVLLRQFLTSIFINVDIGIRENGIFCDILTDQGPLYSGQMKRLAQCEKMIVAVELAGWLNEASLALQAVVQCYGLVAPMLFYKIPALPVIQILQHCHAVLQEIPSGLIQKRQGHVTDSLHHMTACITYHLAKVLRTWGQKGLANSVTEAGRRLLAVDSSGDKHDEKDVDQGSVAETKTGSMTLAALKKKKGGVAGPAAGGGTKSRAAKEDDGVANEELRALEAHMMKVSRAAHGEHELNGNEDPSILHAYIAYLPSKLAYREVVKFRRRARYLEFFVHVAQKALTEGEVDQVVDWCEETDVWLSKRNESIIGTRAFVSKQVGAITVAGDDPKKFAAAVAEYSKKDGPSPRAAKEAAGGAAGTPRAAGKAPSKLAAGTKTSLPKGRGKKSKYKPLGVTASMSEAQKQQQEQQELKALELLGVYFIDLYQNNARKRRLRRITMEEMPWRCQLSMVQGLGCFGSFLQKLEMREKLLGSSSSNMYRTSFLDHEWFTFETAGTLVVGWDGGPSRRTSARVLALEEDEEDEDERDRLRTQALDLASEERLKTTGIEFAAAAATGSAPPPLYPIPPEVEDTPRTYRSDVSKVEDANKLDPNSLPLSTETTIEALTDTFDFFKRAVVLAHRGQHWTLLQNGARTMWNCLHTAMMRALTLAPEGEEAGLLTMARLNDLAWHPLHMATDCLLDMLFYQETDLKQQAAKAKNKGHQLGNYFESWMGSIKNERGGSSLKFEVPLDDISIVDARWVRRMVLRCLEMLYYQQKWEKLVDIALRFSALSNGRYAEQVIPLLVQAQHKVKARIAQVGGPKIPQPHYKQLTAQLGRLVTARDYITVQLKVAVEPARTKLIQPGAQIDPVGHDTYSELDAYRLSSVPLDTKLSLETMRAVLNQSRYTARALQHSRKLLVLYLAGQQNSGVDNLMSRQPTKVDFVPNTARPQPTAPPDLSQEEFLSMDDVQTSPIPHAQLGHVIISYEKTIELLMAKNQKALAAQAMQELGNIHYHAANIRAAYRCWAESLDIVLGMTDALHTWRQETKSKQDISSVLLDRCGLWGCVMGGVLASNIAQYILTADLGLRMECCFLSGYLFKALFRTSLPHPTADRDYALYDVGEGCEVTNLVPGTDFLSDRFRCNGRSVVAALRWVTEELARGRHNLYVLPLLTLYQYFTTFVCRDVQRCVDGRILKVRVLTDLGLFSEAFSVLQRLLHGERLPHIGDSSFRQTESRIGNLRFSTSHPINDLNNLKILEVMLDKRLSSNLATLFGPHLTCHLTLAQSHLFVALAETIPVLPAMEDVIFAVARQQLRLAQDSGILQLPFFNFKMITERFNTDQAGSKTISTMSHPAKGKGKPTEDKKDASVDDISAAATQRFSDGKKLPTLELIKGTLLLIADQMVTTISEVICDNAALEKAGLPGLAAAELELVVLCHLEQAGIAQQKHHAPMAARTVLSALKLMHTSDIFKPKKAVPQQPREDAAIYERPSSIKGCMTSRKMAGAEVRLVDVDSNQFQYQNFQSRARLDPRLWLTCRLALVKALNMEIRGMGEVRGADNKVLTELAECRHYCLEGLKEAEACGDVEVQAEFLVQGALLNIMEGRSLEQTITILDDAVRLLNSISCLSMPAEDLLATCHILRTDLEATTPNEVPSDSPTQRTLQAYLQAQDIILGQMEALGERIEHHVPRGQLRHLSVPVSPMENIYTVQVLRLAHLKLRIGHAMSRNLAKDIRNGQVEEGPLIQWVECLGVLSTALEIMQVSMRREASAEAEILLSLGKVQKMLVYQGKYQPRAAAATLLDAIRVSFGNDHDLGLIRQAYIELALVYLYSCGGIQVKDGSIMESFTGDSGDESIASTKSSVKEKKRWKSKKERAPKVKEEDTEADKERKAAWVAIRCAAATAQAMRARAMMIGNTSITTQKVAEKSQRSMPDFAALDMMNPYVLGEKKKVFKNEIEEELAPLIEAQEVKVQETYENQVNKARTASSDLSWIHVLGYQSILQRLCCTSTIAASSSPPTDGVQESENEGENNSDFDLGFVSRAQFNLGQNYDVVRYMLLAGPWSIRLNHLHQYLCASLTEYANECCAIFPPASLLALAPSPGTGLPADLNVTIKSYASNMSLNSLPDEAHTTGSSSGADSSQPKAPPPPGSTTDPYKPSDKSVLSTTESEVALQWYQPSLEEADPARPDVNPADRRIILLYALSRKGTTVQTSIFPGFTWVSLHKINDLHDRLAVLAQRGEISLVDKVKKDAQGSPPSASTKPKKTQRIKALSPKMQRDEQLENLLRQCMDDMASLLGSLQEQGATSSSEIPFEVSKQNLQNLEQLFDPSLGMAARGADLVQWVYKLFV